MDVGFLRGLLSLTPVELGLMLGLDEDRAEAIIGAWESGSLVQGPAAVALTYLAQGAFAERSGLPEYLVARPNGNPDAPTFVIRSWRPRFIAIAAGADVEPVREQAWTWIKPGARRLVVLQWWDDPAGFDTLDLIYRAAAKVRGECQVEAASTPRVWLDLLQASPSFVAVLDGPHHVFGFVNDACVETMGRHRPYVGSPAEELMPSLRGQGYIDLLDRTFETGRPVAGQDRPLRIEQPDGSSREYIIRYNYEVLRNERGDITSVFAQGLNLTLWRDAILLPPG